MSGVAPRSAHLAIALLFLVNGATFATWASRVPAVRDKLDLSPGSLGIALAGLTAGAVVGLPASGALVARYGSLRVARAGLVLYCLALPLPALAPNLALLVLALFLFGVGNSLLDVAMNAQGVEVERARGRPILGGFHALWSIGGLLGAALGAAVAAAGIPAPIHFALAAAALLAAGLVVTVGMLPNTREGVPGPAFARPTRKLAVLGVIAFCALLAEGVVNDWSAVYLREVAGAGPGIAASGFAAFSLTMAVGRLLSDRIVARTGPRVFVRGAGVVAAAGLTLALLGDGPLPGVAGFGLLGAGLAGILPVVFGVAGGGEHRAGGSGPTIAAVSTVGYLGFLSGPVLVGAVGEFMGLRIALLAVVALAVLMTALAGALPRRHPAADRAAPGAEARRAGAGR